MKNLELCFGLLFNNSKIKYRNLDVKIDLFFYNDKTGFEELEKYYTKDLNTIFND